MNSTPEISGYEFDQRLLRHPLAELWRGRSFTGMEVVALVLSEAGAKDAVVRDRLVRAGRDAALDPEQQETPLWAANFSATRPYAITQLIPGQSGAERLIDPLDGIVGNDEESLQAVRTQLSQYGAQPPPQPPSGNGSLPSYAPAPRMAPAPQAGPAAVAPPTKPSKIELARQYRRKIGGWIYLVVAVIVLIVFTVTYSVGAAIGSSVKDEKPDAEPQAAVTPSPFPSTVLLPAFRKVTTAPYVRPDGGPGVFGATYPAGTDVQVIATAELPFAIGWPRPPAVSFLGESSTIAYRRVQTDDGEGNPRLTPDLRIALRPCKDLAGCLADRSSFDEQWTKVFKAAVPATAKDNRTWLTVKQTKPYALMMTRAFSSGGQWWLVGVAVTGAPGEEQTVQQVLNDIWRQTS
ncbi:hypothetical protein [Kribbella sp. NPDC049227]|uniref:hypothetical protein n=1 Tax=Kribbella sp. NPDC049227 TaxID=3364113 RepID=UPI003711E154